MSRDVTRFFSGPADLCLHDATNGYWYAGFLDDVRVEGKLLSHRSIDGNMRRYAIKHELRAALLQSTQDVTDEFNSTRDGVRQNVYITMLDGLGILSNVYVSALAHSDGAKTDITELLASGLNSYTKKKNLLGNDGAFENDSNSDGVADGWTDGATSTSIVTSHISGNAQRVNLASAGDHFYHDVTVPFETMRYITASLYVKEHTGSATLDFTFGFKTLNTSGAVINTYSANYSLSAGQEQRVSVSQLVQESSPVAKLRIFVAHNGSGGEIRMDNAQLELGRLSDYKGS